MHLTLPDDIWPHIELDRRQPDGRVFRGIRPPPCGISVASWVLQFVRAHHDLPIFWPDFPWVLANGEEYGGNRFTRPPPRPMERQQFWMAPHAARLLRARAEADGAPAAVVLRRLLVQHFGRRPAHPVRVTGGAHTHTPGQGPDCTTCL